MIKDNRPKIVYGIGTVTDFNQVAGVGRDGAVKSKSLKSLSSGKTTEEVKGVELI